MPSRGRFLGRWSRSSREPASAAESPDTASEDPFGLDGDLFQYVTHKTQHGEAFVAYRLLGSPMVLHSLIDGLPLACLHLRVARRRGQEQQAQSLIARRPDRGPTEFLGVITTDDQEFELVMTNLTGKDVLMFDIAGECRIQEPEFWECKDATFWSGRHRNDNRLNRSNILWPLTPNVCAENNAFLQEHGEHRRFVLRARRPSTSGGGEPEAARADDFEGFPIFVYPSYGTPTAARFAKTAWSCPETIMVVGTPTILDGDFREGHNIQTNNVLPQPAQSAPANQGDDEIGQAATSLGVTRFKLLEVLGIDDAFLRELPADMRRNAIIAAFQRADFSALEDELPPEQQIPVKRTLSDNPVPGSSLGARPADVSAGRRVLGTGVHALLIEKFDFANCSADACLALGVRDEIQLIEPGFSNAEEESDKTALTQKLEQLVTTRTAELMENARNNTVFDTAECVVCMETSPPPDAVLYQCGHRCVHLKCVDTQLLRRCPMCRSLIVAVLPLEASRSTPAGDTESASVEPL